MISLEALSIGALLKTGLAGKRPSPLPFLPLSRHAKNAQMVLVESNG